MALCSRTEPIRFPQLGNRVSAMAPCVARFLASCLLVSLQIRWAIASRSLPLSSWWYVQSLLTSFGARTTPFSNTVPDLLHLHHLLLCKYTDASRRRDPVWPTVGCLPDHHHCLCRRSNPYCSSTIPDYVCQFVLGLRSARWLGRPARIGRPHRPVGLSYSICLAMDVACTSSRGHLLCAGVSVVVGKTQ